MGLISFRIDLFDLFAVQRTQESSPAQFECINSLVFSLYYDPTLTSVYDYWNDLLKAAQFEEVVQFRFYTEIIFNMRYVFLLMAVFLGFSFKK